MGALSSCLKGLTLYRKIFSTEKCLTGTQIATVIQAMRAPAQAGMSESCQTGHVFGHGHAEMQNGSWGDGSAGKGPAGQAG